MILSKERQGHSLLDVKTTISADEFWQFSLQFYGLDDNQTLLLWLQDKAGLNVNLVLLLFYLQTKSVYISFNKFSHLKDINKNLDSLTSNYREKRRELKADNIAKGMPDYRSISYQELLKQELDLEKQQQNNLLQATLAFVNDDKNNYKHTDMDIKHYLHSSLSSAEEDGVNKLQSTFDELIDRQQRLAITFGKI